MRLRPAAALGLAACMGSASLLAHEADAEIGLTLTYMQAGEYRRALAFAAHTAGEHRESPDAAALYAALLDIGGQEQLAARLAAPAPRRYGPQSPQSAALPKDARVAASGVLVGATALAPAAPLRQAKRLWVRDALGRVARAELARVREDTGIAELALRDALGESALHPAPRDAFPGSVAYALAFPPDAGAAWPVMRAGFLGKARLLGVELPPGARGGPVLDAAGRLVGVSIADADGADRLVPVSLLRPYAGAAAGEDAKLAPDEIYERALQSTLQVLTAP